MREEEILVILKQLPKEQRHSAKSRIEQADDYGWTDIHLEAPDAMPAGEDCLVGVKPDGRKEFIP